MPAQLADVRDVVSDRGVFVWSSCVWEGWAILIEVADGVTARALVFSGRVPRRARRRGRGVGVGAVGAGGTAITLGGKAAFVPRN